MIRGFISAMLEVLAYDLSVACVFGRAFVFLYVSACREIILEAFRKYPTFIILGSAIL